MTRLNPRCDHGMLLGTCAICLGQHRKDSRMDVVHECLPRQREILPPNLVEVIDDSIPRHSRRAPTLEEMKETEETMEEQLMCPKCQKNPSPGRRSDNNEPKICKACLSEMARQRTKGTPKPAEETREPEKSAPVMAAGLDVLNQLQERLDQRVAEVRKLHLAMLTIREACGVEYKIRMPSLVGMETKSPSSGEEG